MSNPHKGPTYGVLIECVIDDDPREGLANWIDLEEVEEGEDVQRIIDFTTGRDECPYPDSWIEEGTFEVREVRGLGPRLSECARDVDGPFVNTLTHLANALTMLDSEQQRAFLAWAELNDWWEPGYLPDTGGHTSEDVVHLFLCETTLPVIHETLSDEQEFGLKKLELGLRKTMKRKPEELVTLCVSQSRLLRQSEQLIADMVQQARLLQSPAGNINSLPASPPTGASPIIPTDDQLEANYRNWWAQSYGVPPNRQAVAAAVAWGRQLVDGLVVANRGGAEGEP